MANLQIKGMDDDLYAQLKALAASENRSISQQILFLLKLYLARKHQLQGTRTSAQVLLELSDSWEDDRPAEQIVKKLKAGRKRSQKLRKGF
jgi:hypothetical protein